MRARRAARLAGKALLALLLLVAAAIVGACLALATLAGAGADRPR